MDKINNNFHNFKMATEKYNAEAIYRKTDDLNVIRRHQTRMIEFKKFEDMRSFYLFTDADIYGGDTFAEPTLNIQDNSCIIC
jgi:hypothetical protein